MLRAAVRREKRDKVTPSLSGVDGPDNGIPPVRAALRDEGLRAENSAYGQS